MKKLVNLLLILSFSILILPNKALAQEETIDTVEAGLTTESPIYFLDRWAEAIELFFTSQEEKPEKLLQFAQERLAEMEEIADTATEEELEVLGEEYEDELDKIENEEGVTEQLKERVREARERHIRVLERVRENAPEQAVPGLERVLERTRERIENPVLPGEQGQEGDELMEEKGIGERIKDAFNNVVNRKKGSEDADEDDQDAQLEVPTPGTDTAGNRMGR
jgi:oligoribonuclease NrnB/cAMP/cGMP phosphodiesterase (DHH superfamily)